MAVVAFEFGDDSRGNEIRRLLETFRADAVDQLSGADYEEELARGLDHEEFGRAAGK